jgi:hypothetical protein
MPILGNFSDRFFSLKGTKHGGIISKPLIL